MNPLASQPKGSQVLCPFSLLSKAVRRSGRPYATRSVHYLDQKEEKAVA